MHSITLADGTPIPEEAEHLKNGYYYLPSDRTVYDGNSTPCFTVEADGFIPCDSTGVSAYIVAKKQVDGKDRYVLLDTEGKAVTADYAEPPAKVGRFLCAEGNMMDADGKVVAMTRCCGSSRPGRLRCVSSPGSREMMATPL